MSLLDTYENMVKEANQTKETEQAGVEDERVEVLNKYASWADQTLKSEYGEGEYTSEDVEKLATIKLNQDAEEAENREKVAEYFEAGQIMYQGFKAAAESDA